LTGADSQKVEKALDDRKKLALSKDAMRKPTAFLPSGSWANARRGGWGGDRGSRNRLTG
jgi:hypothetical protein